jgi:hypothetical protein
MAGKGSSPRPFSISIDEYQSNFERIFGSKDKKQVVVSQDGIIEIDVIEELKERDNTPGL